MLSQVDSEGHHYQVLTEVTGHKKDYSSIAKIDGFINLIVETYTGRGRLIAGNS